LRLAEAISHVCDLEAANAARTQQVGLGRRRQAYMMKIGFEVRLRWLGSAARPRGEQTDRNAALPAKRLYRACQPRLGRWPEQDAADGSSIGQERKGRAGRRRAECARIVEGYGDSPVLNHDARSSIAGLD